MPKRTNSIQNQHIANPAKSRRKSVCIDNSSALPNNAEQNDNEIDTKNSRKQMQYIPSNLNNEVERLLMHNSASLLNHVDHSGFPAFNVGMWPMEDCDMLINYPTCAFSIPRAIYVSNGQSAKIDICYKRPMNRYFFKSRMRLTKTCYQTSLKSNKNLRSCRKDNIYHYSVFEMAERAYKQPDPFFHSSYDFYFTGGNLCVLPLKGTVLHAGGENLQYMMASEFPVADENTDINSLRNFSILNNSTDSEIFEYHPFITPFNSSRQNCFLARQRNRITFNYVNDKNEIRTVTQFQTKSTPFISFAQSERSINNFIITTMKQHIRLYDLDSKSPSLAKIFTVSPNSENISWNTVKPWRENTFLYANQKQFLMIDVRTSPEQWLKEVTIANNDLRCDHISALKPSDFNNLFYVATNHKLHCMDIRHLKENTLKNSVSGICRWSHQLHYAPLMIDTFRVSQTEYVAVSSPIAGDLHICQLSRERNDNNICLVPSVPASKHIYSSLCLPYQPPTLLESYKNYRSLGKRIRSEANLEARIKFCTTGMTFFKLDSNRNSGIGLLLTSNSNGDVFAHTLSKREDQENEERCNKQSDAVMTNFEQKICNQSKQLLSFTEIRNMKGLRKVFLYQPLNAKQKIDIDAMDQEFNDDEEVANAVTRTAGKSNPKRLHLGRWQKSLSTLHSYKDALAADLLSIWDIDILEENDTRLGNLGRNVTTDPKVKVENWLKENIRPNPPQMLSIPLNEIKRLIGNNSCDALDNTLNLSQTTIGFENAVHSTQIFNNPVNISTGLDISGTSILLNDTRITKVSDNLKNKKKPKKYVKGF